MSLDSIEYPNITKYYNISFYSMDKYCFCRVPAAFPNTFPCHSLWTIWV